MTTSNDITNILSDIGKLVGNLPNVVTMSDERALRFGDVSSALALTGIYLADFRTTGCIRAARKHLAMATQTSDELAALAIGQGRDVGQVLVVAQRALIEANAQFQALVNAKVAARA